ncbi:hypothetical protein P389DRAFT_171633 [Cystobasidium minutum MCA 4210]|uniref:uncharacterized protein n=1 Tax=Cystobasidium minutum MCA 4210 TaxID=1397322 RepID=UPI0034CF2D28|eukprot:jgi/Rhomi1/171633/fgenesh1_kg.4_\
MVKKRQGGSSSSGVSSQQQRRAAAAKTRQQIGQDEQGSNSTASSKSYIILRSTLPASSFIPAVSIQVIAVAFCLFLLNGQPTSYFKLTAYLRPLMYDTKKALLKIIPGILLVQLYSAIQLKLWSDRSLSKASSTGSSDTAKAISQSQEEEVTPSRDDVAQDSVHRKALLPGSVQKYIASFDFSKIDLPSIPETLLSLPITSVLLFVMIILMGAPMARLLPETALFSAYLAVLAFTAPLHVLRSPYSTTNDKIAVRSQWSRLFASFRPRSDIEIAMLLPAYGAIIGTMIGVIPEGLDWEESWQKWPVPCLLGSYVGWAIGQFATLEMCSILWVAKSDNQSKLGNSVTSTVR